MSRETSQKKNLLNLYFVNCVRYWHTWSLIPIRESEYTWRSGNWNNENGQPLLLGLQKSNLKVIWGLYAYLIIKLWSGNNVNRWKMSRAGAGCSIVVEYMPWEQPKNCANFPPHLPPATSILASHSPKENELSLMLVVETTIPGRPQKVNASEWFDFPTQYSTSDNRTLSLYILSKFYSTWHKAIRWLII